MDIEIVIRRVVNDKAGGDWTYPAGDLGPLIADALADAGLAQLDDEQVADYIRDLGDRAGTTAGDIAVALAEVIEGDLDEGEDRWSTSIP